MTTPPPETLECWAILMRHHCPRFGYSEGFLGMTEHPCRKALFNTRADARRFIAKVFPSPWRRDSRKEAIPSPIRVKVSIEAL